MKRLTVVLLSMIMSFSILSCNNDDDDPVEEIPEPPVEVLPPMLKVVNEATDDRFIKSVLLVNYDFNNLNITSNNSQTFTLDNGMPAGNTGINVTVYFVRTGTNITDSINTSADFVNGEITTIIFAGCLDAEGCDGYTLETL